jgi:hypothetical protein
MTVEATRICGEITDLIGGARLPIKTKQRALEAMDLILRPVLSQEDSLKIAEGVLKFGDRFGDDTGSYPWKHVDDRDED